MEEVTELRDKLNNVTDKHASAAQSHEQAVAEIESLKESLNVQKQAYEREVRKKTAMEREKNMLEAQVKVEQDRVSSKQNELSEQQDILAQQQDEAMLKNHEIENLHNKADAIDQNNRKLEKQRDSIEREVDAAKEENHLLKRAFKEKETELSGVKKEAQDLSKFNDKLKRQLQASQEKLLEAEEKKTALKTETGRLERDLEDSKKRVQEDNRKLDSVTQARDILAKKTLVAGSETQAQKELVQQQENRLKTLDQEIGVYKQEAAKQRQLMSNLEKERDRFINESSVASHRAMTALEDHKIADNQIFDYKKKIAEAEMRLKQQQSLYEAVRSDRNLLSKNHLETKGELRERVRQLKIMTHQIEQLKEEITTKEKKLTDTFNRFDVEKKQKEKLNDDMADMKLKTEKLQKSIADHNADQHNLNLNLAEIKNKNARLKKQHDEVLKERDMLSTQLTRREDELKLVYEKIKIQQSTLAKGETQYRNRLDDIRLLKMKIKQLQREKTILAKTVANVEQLKTDVHHAQRDLLKERTRCRALEEELETPLNVHRWRKLQGTDPAMYEKIQKIQTLQKRLISKTEEVVEKELMLQDSEREYVELKQVLARQPGPEVSEQLQIYQQTLKDKTKQLKSMASELNMYQAETSEYKYEIERLARELQDVKKKYFEHKRKEMLVRDKNMQFTNSQQMTGRQRVTGGGFNMSHPGARSPQSEGKEQDGLVF